MEKPYKTNDLHLIFRHWCLYTAIACCFPSTMIAYEKEQLKHFEAIY